MDMIVQICDSLAKKFGIVLEATESVVASGTQKASNAVTGMAVVNMQSPVSLARVLWFLIANGASAILRFEHRVELVKAEAKSLDQVAVKGFGFAVFGVPFASALRTASRAGCIAARSLGSSLLPRVLLNRFCDAAKSAGFFGALIAKKAVLVTTIAIGVTAKIFSAVFAFATRADAVLPRIATHQDSYSVLVSGHGC